jgi:hypothetical protein
MCRLAAGFLHLVGDRQHLLVVQVDDRDIGTVVRKP